MSKNQNVVTESPDVAEINATTAPPSLIDQARAFVKYPDIPAELEVFRDVKYRLLKKIESMGGLLGSVSFLSLKVGRLEQEARTVATASNPEKGAELLLEAGKLAADLRAKVAELEAYRAEYSRLQALDDAVNVPTAGTTTTEARSARR
mgnify:CR=1 FL=1